MASRNGHTVIDMVRNGFWKRRVQKLNDDGTVGVSIPSEFAQDNDISEGDDIVLKRPDGDQEHALEVYVE